MKITPAVTENLKKIAVLNLALVAVENLVFFIAGYWTLQVLVGSLYGYGISILSFTLLGISVQKAMDKEQKQAQMYMQSTYTGRMVLTAVLIVIVMVTNFANWFSAVIPLTFTRISIMLINFKKKEE